MSLRDNGREWVHSLARTNRHAWCLSRHARPQPFTLDARCALRAGAFGHVGVVAAEGGNTMALDLFARNGAVHVTYQLAALHALVDFAAACFQELRSGCIVFPD